MVRTYLQRIIQVVLVALFGIIISQSAIRGTLDSRQFAKELQDLPDDHAYIVFLAQETGSYEFIGKDAEWAALYAVEQVNAAGGVNGKPVELVIRDTKSDPQKAVNYYAGAADAALTIIGPADAPEAAIIAAMQAGGSGLCVFSGYSDSAISANAPYALSYLSDSLKGELQAVRHWHESNPDIRRVVIFSSSDDAAKTETVSELQKFLPKLGLEICSVVDVTADALSEKGYTGCVIEALNQKADGYISILHTADYAPLLQELRKRGVEEGRRITASFTSFSQETREKAGDALDGTYIWNTFDPGYESEEWAALAEAYRQDHNQNDPQTPAVPGMYNSVLSVCKCYEELDLDGIVRSDPVLLEQQQKAAAQWLYNSEEIRGIQGPCFWKNGQMQSSPCYFIFDGNTPVLTEE